MVKDPLTLDRDGAECFDGAATACLMLLERLFDRHLPNTAGTRLFDCGELSPLVAPDTPIAVLACQLLGASAIPVRAVLFDKEPNANWSLGWHQDRVIAVRRRRDLPGFHSWSIKQGVDHVTPPWALFETMRTLRVHLDPVTIDNAPLLVAPGTHRLGPVPEPAIKAAVAHAGQRACLANTGDVWAYATSILHASASSTSGRHRRVLQLDYAAFALPGLEWRGV